MIETLIALITLIIPIENKDDREGFIETTNRLDSVISDNVLISSTGLYGIKDRKHPDYKTLVMLDILRDGYISYYSESFNNEHLWGTLSALLTTYGQNDYRKNLSFEIYDNPTIDYTIENSSLAFSQSNYMVYGIEIHNFKAIGIIDSDKFQNLKSLMEKLNIQIREMK
ncbi:hypothetical protein NQT66_17640 [Cellulophaga baltica]|uniref:hypothetical protein n=1 Tax=Cellulophaga baltica TaxID=76594 RepID=UPI0021487BFF|nr:hypothetical protein [Cellulophaga baltica]MCR1026646.1 hypothetical protein [Cellulophaga baltica]